MFRFKQFRLQQSNTAMKVGTDGVLLGAWAPIEHEPQSILDIGSGTGLVALMLAQRSEAFQIDAIEIEEGAFEDSVTNFEHSPWADRLYCYHASLDEFHQEMQEEQYDLIVSNPPFFEVEPSQTDYARFLARSSKAMPFDQLLEAVADLLSEEGVFAVVVPHEQAADLTEMAAQLSLFVLKSTLVRGTIQAPIKRQLLAFSRKQTPQPLIDELVLETERHVRTPAYQSLTEAFYLSP
ncbi:MAG: tRNA (adenine-N(6)-)-methyltransferase [Flavobacterium sp. BFFFF2]|nr:MAG: tRNA (adenine-N(6)-)-methyltransferase [Flavobacterium sp. BFFFF2]